MQIRRSLVGMRIQVSAGLSLKIVPSRASRGQRACLGCCHGESIDAIETGAARRLARTRSMHAAPPFPEGYARDTRFRARRNNNAPYQCSSNFREHRNYRGNDGLYKHA